MRKRDARFFSSFLIFARLKMRLPRQARDEGTKHSKERAVFLSAKSPELTIEQLERSRIVMINAWKNIAPEVCLLHFFPFKT